MRVFACVRACVSSRGDLSFRVLEAIAASPASYLLGVARAQRLKLLPIKLDQIMEQHPADVAAA